MQKNNFARIQGVAHFEGGKAGPRVVIMGSIHGNERVGAAVLKQLRREIMSQPIAGSITLVLGNPDAYKADKRFIAEDLNRLFSGERLEEIGRLSSFSRNIEQQRALQIAPILKTADYLLDIHSTLKPSVPFVFCDNTRRHISLAKTMGTPHIVSPYPLRSNELMCSADSYVDALGGIGLTYESGWRLEQANVPEVVQVVKRFLSKIGSQQLVSGKENESKNKAIQWFIYDHLIPTTNSFRFNREYANFDQIPMGEIIAEDVGKKYLAKKDSIIIFPKKEIIVGKAAGYLATRKT